MSEARPVKTIYLEDITAATNKLIERSAKFKAFFSRAELEEHVAVALYETRAALSQQQEGKDRCD